MNALSRGRHRVIASLLIACVATLAGCAEGRHVRGPTDAASGTDTIGSQVPFVTLEKLPASGSISADDLVPGHPGVERWRSLEGLLAPDGFDLETKPSTSVTGAQATRTADLETAHWIRQADGGLALDRVDSHPDQTTSLFIPPLLIAPPSLEANVQTSSASAMRAVLTTRPESVRDRGTGRRIVRYVRDERVRWMGNEERVKVAEITFTAELGSAKVTRQSELWVLPGEGVIAERWNETLVILKLITKESGQFAVRERR